MIQYHRITFKKRETNIDIVKIKTIKHLVKIN